LLSESVIQPKPILYLFIDGGYLRSVYKEFSAFLFNGTAINIDYEMIKYETQAKKVFYYDCIAPKKSSQSPEEYDSIKQNQQQVFDSIKMLPGFHVREGVMRLRRKEFEQKQVDVGIAVDVLMHSVRKNMDQVVLLTGDLDFKPLVDALLELGMYTTIMCERSSVSNELLHSADDHLFFNYDDLYKWTTNSFKHENQMPITGIYAGQTLNHLTKLPILADAKLLKTGLDNETNPLFLYKKSSEYVIIRSKKGNHQEIYQFSDLNKLEIYIAKQHFSYIWSQDHKA